MTNAHVVAGETDTTVQVARRGLGSRREALVFDPHNDIAVLRVPGLSAPALTLASGPVSGESAAILGYPLDGPFERRAGRLGQTERAPTADAYGNATVREISSLRGLVEAGQLGRPDGGRGRSGDRHGVRRDHQRATGEAGRVRGPEQCRRWRAGAGADTAPHGEHPRLRRLMRRPRLLDRTLRSCPDEQDARDRREAVGRPGPQQGAARPVHHDGDKRVLEGPEHIVTWAVGHLVQLADPDEYDEKYAKWRMPDLPIVPKKFKLVVRDERSKQQMTAVKRELDRDDVDLVVNACDAGREGELIFAYLYEKAGSKLPVKRLWLNSMTNSAIKEAFASLRPSEEYHTLEEAARSRSEADWIVGMNATRAATISLRSSFDGAVSLGRVQTPTLAILARREQEIRDFKPEPYWVVDARFLALPEEPRRAYDGRYHLGAGTEAADRDRRGGRRDRRRLRGPDRHDHQAREAREQGSRAVALRPDRAAARRVVAFRVHRESHAARRPAALRGAQGADLSAHQLALHHQRHDPRHQADRGAGRRASGSTRPPPPT